MPALPTAVKFDKMANTLCMWDVDEAAKDENFSVQDEGSFVTFQLPAATPASPQDASLRNRDLQDSAVVTHGAATPAEEAERGGWGNKLDFLFSCISLSVGLGNVWRFPYLCYKNGGGSFLITYGISMIFCGIPLFFQEVAIGQYLGSGGMTFVGQLCPLLKGVGYATMTIVFLLDVYYCIIIAWTIFYILSLIVYLPKLPWATCDNWWNTDNCYLVNSNNTVLNISKKVSPVAEFYERRVLNISEGLEDIGGVEWHLFVCLIAGWLFVYCVIRKGLHQSGKVIWFTALFPYAVLLILLGRAVTLTGADDGLLYYVTPRWEKLLSPGPWMDGATQIFFAYSIGCGALPALGSYNKFHHNSYKDALITCVVNTLTSLMAGIVTFSILGHIAFEQNVEVGKVVNSGPGLVFLTYPEVVLKLPGAPFWAATFFIMLVILGIDSQFCLVESFITGFLDNWSQQLRPYRYEFTAVVCFVMFLLGIPMVTKGGMFMFQLMDYYSASGISLLWVCFFQTVGISWVFGVDKLCDCIEQMMGVRPNIFWKLSWKIFCPLVMIVIFVSHCAQFQTLSYGNYHYPAWANGIGYCLSLASMMWVPIYALFYVTKGHGTILQNFKNGLKSQIKQRKISMAEKYHGMPYSESNVGLIFPSKQCLDEEM